MQPTPRALACPAIRLRQSSPAPAPEFACAWEGVRPPRLHRVQQRSSPAPTTEFACACTCPSTGVVPHLHRSSLQTPEFVGARVRRPSFPPPCKAPLSFPPPGESTSKGNSIQGRGPGSGLSKCQNCKQQGHNKRTFPSNSSGSGPSTGSSNHGSMQLVVCESQVTFFPFRM